MSQLGEYVGSTAEDLGIPGVGVGILCDGRQEYAPYGVTSIENPLSVTSETMFQIGSITKTYTATAVAVLAERRLLDLDAPCVGTYPSSGWRMSVRPPESLCDSC